MQSYSDVDCRCSRAAAAWTRKPGGRKRWWKGGAVLVGLAGRGETAAMVEKATAPRHVRDAGWYDRREDVVRSATDEAESERGHSDAHQTMSLARTFWAAVATSTGG